MIKDHDPYRVAIGLAVVAALTFVTYKSPGQLGAFAAILAGPALLFASTKKADGEP